MNSPTPPVSLGRLVAARELSALADLVARNGAATASGLWGSSVAAVVAAVEKKLDRPYVLVCGHLDEADDLADDIELFTAKRPDILPALELSGSMGQLSEEQVSNRLRLISRYANADAAQRPRLVAPIQSLMQSVPSVQQLQHLVRTLKVGQELEPEKLIVWLADHGYNRLDQVEVPGDFAVRGGIVDLYLPGDFEEEPDPATGVSEMQVGLTIRIDFFGDQIESIRKFDLDSLGSGEKLTSIRVMDLKGNLPETSGSTHLLSYLDPETIIVLWAPLEIAEQSKSYLDRLPEVKGIYPLAALLKNMAGFARLELSQFDQGTATMPTLVGAEAVAHFTLPINSLQRFETEAKKAIAELNELAQTHDVTVFCENEGEVKRFCELLEQDAPALCSRISTPIGYLHRGFVYELRTQDSGPRTASKKSDTQSSVLSPQSFPRPLALLGHHELFHRYEQRRRVKKVIA